MANIRMYLNKILSAIYGKDVRQAIHDAIYQCYLDGKAGAEDLIAREGIAALQTQVGTLSAASTEDSGAFSSMEAVRAYVANRVANDMACGDVMVLSVRLDTYDYSDGARLTIHRGQDSDAIPVASAELYTDSGHRAHLSGYCDSDPSVLSNWVWNPWEHDNPPMLGTVEYRTTERIGGKPVHAYSVRFTDIDTIVGTTVSENLQIQQGSYEDIRIVGISAVVTENFVAKPYPCLNGSDPAIELAVTVEDGTIAVSLTTLREVEQGTMADVIVKYTY